MFTIPARLLGVFELLKLHHRYKMFLPQKKFCIDSQFSLKKEITSLSIVLLLHFRSSLLMCCFSWTTLFSCSPLRILISGTDFSAEVSVLITWHSFWWHLDPEATLHTFGVQHFLFKCWLQVLKTWIWQSSWTTFLSLTTCLGCPLSIIHQPMHLWQSC